ncbi:GNAT family N-acetyltransferase [Desemzia sp. RIT804]|uniref:GNAT family N-acetyltransferase n=1 Tax=Desemzia sp. RIT 804 TaxID=2810209 RepID=UPI001950EC8F|nr:GNAT family N-acetyltransferase [Desemzia sp. RIT 804]
MQIVETRDPKLMGQLGKTMQEKHRNMYPDFFKPYNEEAIALHFETVFQNPKEKVFLWVDDTKEEQSIAAYLWLDEQTIKETVYRYGYTRLYISHIAVLPEYQNQGLSKELLHYADEYARERNIELVELHYWATNEIAKETYLKNGFTIYNEIAQKRV